ncbi:unnamed protein product, partial [Musa banksii]
HIPSIGQEGSKKDNVTITLNHKATPQRMNELEITGDNLHFNFSSMHHKPCQWASK